MKPVAPTSASDHRHGSLLVVLLALGVWVACFRFPVVWDATGIGESHRPFLDLYGLLASSDAAKAGIDPFRLNDFDPYHRPLVYTEWWLAAGKIGLTRDDTPWLGWVLVGATLLTVVAMVRPRTRRECVTTFLWLVSPAMLLAVNRANNDLVVFMVMSAGLLALRASHWPGRALGVVLFAVAAALKYYPLAGLVVLLDARTRRELAGGIAIYAVVLIFAWPPLAAGLASAARFKPNSEWIYAFGAPVLFRDFGLKTSAGWLALTAVLVIWSAWSAWRETPAFRGDEMSRTRTREFMVGAALIVGCFFLGGTYVYKLVFAAWLLPWLWREERHAAEGPWRVATGWLLAAVMSLEGLMAVVLNRVVTPLSFDAAEILLAATLFTTQLLTWGLVACLLRFLVQFARHRGRELLARA